MSETASTLVCRGCGWQAPPAAGFAAFRCARARRGDDIDHVMRRVLDPARVAFPQGREANPFIRYRSLLHSYHVATSGGVSDADYVAFVQGLDREVVRVDARGLVVTPFTGYHRLGARLGLAPGRLWVKDETGNVSGSHKARHLFGVMLHLQVMGRLKPAPTSDTGADTVGRLKPAPTSDTGADAVGRLKPAPTSDTGADAVGRLKPAPTNVGADVGAELARPDVAVVGAGFSRPVLAIASCGNAALAAAILARAAARSLDVFVPAWADATVVARLRALGARLTTCTREPGVAGDPCYRRFLDAVDRGAVPFCCQGPDNGLTIEGGSTTAWEMIDAAGERTIDRLFVQVGGGALASAIAGGFADALRLGRLARLPRLHAVQTRGGFPLKRAYDRVLARIASRLPAARRAGLAPPPRPEPPSSGRADAGRDEGAARDFSRAAGAGLDSGDATVAALADIVRAHADSPTVREELDYAATHRAEFMWPWESEPRSIATGILDDETYDWLAVVEGMLLSGGYPVVVGEQSLRAANALGRDMTGIDVDHTGTAGMAGLMQALDDDQELRQETVAVIFTGVRRA